jgi:hypothetical protein
MQNIIWYRSKRSKYGSYGATKMFLKKSTPKAASGLLFLLKGYKQKKSPSLVNFIQRAFNRL